MDEVWARLGLIAGALLVALVVTLVLRARARGAPQRLESTGLEAGIYYFSSASCPDCRSVRRKLTEALGESGFLEFNWEQQPGVFHDLSVDAVPATLVVNTDGSGTLYPGQPDRALATVGP